MNSYYLRVEGVNFDSFVFDTNELSTIRGGGLLLLEVVDKVRKIIKAQGVAREVITKGASWGLVSFEAQDDHCAARLAEVTRQKLHVDSKYGLATLTVEVLPAGTQQEYTETKSKLEAISRWHQMQAPSLVMPEATTEDNWPCNGKEQHKIPVCQFDHTRPATKPLTKGDKQYAVSSSVYVRQDHGKDSKRKKWYGGITKLTDLPEFVHDFNELAEDKNYGNLSGKMAVIYLDGNNFGKLQRAYCTSAEKQKKFDTKIREECQNGTLKLLLETIRNSANWLTKDKKLRFETLLWGGDEVIWVVPAWQGWRTLAFFFDQVENNWKFDDKTLSLAAGMVFCHHNAPIQRIKQLARSLGDLAKGNRTKNRVAYQVLESFDHAGVDLEAFRKTRCPEGISSEALVLDGKDMLPLIKTLKTLKNGMAKRQLHRLVQSLYAGENSVEASQQLMEEIESITSKEDVQNIEKCLGQGSEHWLHLLELWDYIAPVRLEEERYAAH